MDLLQTKQIIRQVINEVNVNEYLSPKTVAAKLSLSTKTVIRWCQSGELKSTKFGRLFRVKRSDFIKYCQENEL